MITTFSKFYYLGEDISEDNYYLDFDEGGSELSATVAVGSYTPTDLCTAIKTALDAAGALTYTVTFNRSTRLFTISAGSNFTLRNVTGSHVGTSIWSLIGFTQGSNRTGASTYSGAAAGGDVYVPQFKLQSYVSTDDFQEAVESTVNETASGNIEVVKFGTRKFVELNITFATDIAQTGGVITSNTSGVSDLRRFMQYAVTKAPVEFMADKDTPATYQKLVLESTPTSQKGVGYKLRELYDKGLPGYFETGILKFRLIED